MPSKLLGCIGVLYKIVHKTARFSVSQFSFPFNCRPANALVLQFGTLPLRCLFSNSLVAIFVILFCSRVVHRFLYWKMVQNWHAGLFFNITLCQKRIKKSRARFFSAQIILAEETKRMCLARPVFNLEALGAFIAYFHLFRHLKVIQLFQKYAKTFYFWQAFRQKNRMKIATPSGFKIRFLPSGDVKHPLNINLVNSNFFAIFVKLTWSLSISSLTSRFLFVLVSFTAGCLLASCFSVGPSVL